MTNRIIFSVLLILSSLILKAEGYKISVQWKGISDTTLLLARYYDSNIYVNDTIVLDNKGKGIFSGDSLLNEGLYMLYLNGDKHVDFILGEKQNISISTNNNYLIDSLIVKGAYDSEEFCGYQKFIRRKSTEKNKILKQLEATEGTSRQSLIEQIDAIDDEMSGYIDETIHNAGNSMLGVFIKATKPLNIPKPNISPDHPAFDSIMWFNAYNYRRDHFLDGIDFTDDRILNTPLLRQKLESYFNQVLIQSPDSIIPQAIGLIRKSEPNKKTYQYVSQFLINNSSSSKIMGMDAVFVAVADEVYLSGKASWVDDETIKKIAEEVFLTRPNLIGNKAPELVMQNIDGEYISLHQMPSTYTIIVFYEYNCGHCKRDIPGLYNNIFMKYIGDNVDVFAVCMNDDREKWEEFIEEHELEGWHNVWDPNHQTQFRFKYNTKTSPLIYLLDKDKKIIAKKIDQDNLSKLLGSLLTK
jgi:peroxiredoxin